MNNKLFYLALGCAFIITLVGHQALSRWLTPPPLSGSPQRIVSLAPSITESLYALGLDEQIVGVTQFCQYPPQARNKAKVAGFVDVNYEAVLRQRPDLVVMPADKVENRLNLERLGLRVLTVDTRSLSGVMSAIMTLGQSNGQQKQADAILAKMHDSINKAQQRAQGRNRPSVLFSVMHADVAGGAINNINAIGQDGFFDELITIAGGKNVYQGRLAFPRLSREAIIFLNPDIIIDVIRDGDDLAAVQQSWQTLTTVNAIKNKRLYLLTDRGDTIPGPRFPNTLEKLSFIIHP